MDTVPIEWQTFFSEGGQSVLIAWWPPAHMGMCLQPCEAVGTTVNNSTTQVEVIKCLGVMCVSGSGQHLQQCRCFTSLWQWKESSATQGLNLMFWLWSNSNLWSQGRWFRHQAWTSFRERTFLRSSGHLRGVVIAQSCLGNTSYLLTQIPIDSETRQKVKIKCPLSHGRQQRKPKFTVRVLIPEVHLFLRLGQTICSSDSNEKHITHPNTFIKFAYHISVWGQNISFFILTILCMLFWIIIQVMENVWTAALNYFAASKQKSTHRAKETIMR